MDAPETPKRGIYRSLSLIEDAMRDRETLTLEELIRVLGKKSHLFVMLFLMLPFLQPIPLPGLSTIIALVVAAIAVSFGRASSRGFPSVTANAR